MKYTKYLTVIFLLGFSLISIQADQSQLEKISANTYNTAENTKKDSYDYLSYILSGLAFIVAGITLHYSVKTYKSQKRTELNTRRWGSKQERFVLRQVGLKLIDNINILIHINKLMAPNSPGARFVNNLDSRTFEKMKIDVSILHSDDIFDDISESVSVWSLKNSIEEYNDRLDKLYIFLDSGLDPYQEIYHQHGTKNFFYNRFFMEVYYSLKLFVETGDLHNRLVDSRIKIDKMILSLFKGVMIC